MPSTTSLDLADPAEWVQRRRGSSYDAADRASAVLMTPSETALTRTPRDGVLDRERAGDRGQAALGQRRQRRRACVVGRGRPGWCVTLTT